VKSLQKGDLVNREAKTATAVISVNHPQ